MGTGPSADIKPLYDDSWTPSEQSQAAAKARWLEVRQKYAEEKKRLQGVADKYTHGCPECQKKNDVKLTFSVNGVYARCPDCTQTACLLPIPTKATVIGPRHFIGWCVDSGCGPCNFTAGDEKATCNKCKHLGSGHTQIGYYADEWNGSKAQRPTVEDNVHVI